MVVKTAFDDFMGRLKFIYSAGEAAAIAGWVFEVVVGMGQSAIMMNPQVEMAQDKRAELEQYLAELLTHKPVQYVLGEAWFYKMKFAVNEQVLIPRPETEELVEWCVKEVGNKEYRSTNDEVGIGNGEMVVPGESGYSFKVAGIPHSSFVNRNLLDIGTGSGCIAIALKKELPALAVTGIDVSEGALLVARQNAVDLGAEVDFMQVDFLDENSWSLLPQFDVIVSNPPYIPLNEKARLDSNVTAHEPHAALFVPDNAPLLFYEKIARFGMEHLKPGGFIMMETHEDYAQQTAELFKGNYTTVICRKDISGKERMVMAAL
jgi:release factor glutamine methyltransferase